MKKLLKFLGLVILACAIFTFYYHLYDIPLFSYEDINTPAYQEETSEHSDGTQFEKLYYSQLDSGKKKIYDKIYFAIKEHKDYVRIYRNISNQDLFDIVSFVIAENPELFWSNAACTIDSTGKLTFDYIYTEDEIEYYKSQIEQNTSSIIAQANAISDEYERALLLFNFVIENTTYDRTAAENISGYPEASTIAGAFVNKKAICGGYSKAYQYLLSKCSLNAETVYGNAKTSDGSENHAWTLQFLNGNYYYTDATWGDSYESSDTQGYTSHLFFCMTEKDMSKTHTLDSNISYPQCTANADNYFIREGLYFSTFDKSSLKKAIANQIENENYFIEIRFKNQSDYNNAVEDLITSSGICYMLFEIDPFQRRIEVDNLSFSTDDTKYVITLILKQK